MSEQQNTTVNQEKNVDPESQKILSDLKGKSQEEIAKSWLNMFNIIKQNQTEKQELEQMNRKYEEQINSFGDIQDKASKYEQMIAEQAKRYQEAQEKKVEPVFKYLSELKVVEPKNEDHYKQINEIMLNKDNKFYSDALFMASENYAQIRESYQSLEERNQQLECVLDEFRSGKQNQSMENQPMGDQSMGNPITVQNSRRAKQHRDLFDTMFEDSAPSTFESNMGYRRNNNNNNNYYDTNSTRTVSNNNNNNQTKIPGQRNLSFDLKNSLHNFRDTYGRNSSAKNLAAQNPSLFEMILKAEPPKDFGIKNVKKYSQAHPRN